MPRKLKVGFIMGGGVSLGTFSGGAFGRVVEHLEKDLDPSFSSCEIDVVTGASAGSVTLALGIRELAAGELPADKMHELWVDEMSIENLLPADPWKHQLPSILTDKRLRKLATRLMQAPAGTKPPKAVLAPQVLMGFTLTSLAGVPVKTQAEIVAQPVGGSSALGDTLNTTFFTDTRVFSVDRTRDPGTKADFEDERLAFHPSRPEGWQAVTEACIASGAFPGAFPPVTIMRHAKEYGRLWPKMWSDPQPIAYVDGGVLNNEPLKLAIELARRLDETEVSEEDYLRVFVVIDPSLSSGDAAKRGFFTGNHTKKMGERKGPPGLINALGRVAGGVAAEAGTKDWLKVAKVNAHLDWADQMVHYLVRVLRHADGAAFVSSFGHGDPRPRELLASIIEQKYRATSRDTSALTDAKVGQYLQAQLDKVGRLWNEELRVLGPQEREVAVGLIALLENVAGLRRKRKLNMVGIAPVPGQQLAGAFGANFGGFFNVKSRGYDYRVGRHRATEALAAMHSTIRFVKPGVAAPDPGPPPRTKAKYKPIPKAIKKRFEKFIHDYIERTVEPYVGDFVDDLVAGKLTKKLMAVLSRK